MIKLKHPAWPLRPNPLRWVISSLLLTPGLAHASAPQGIEAVAGPGGMPLVDTSRSVPVVGIVPPSPQGISHNQYQQYNVGAEGVVLNNSLTPGASQLAGQLPANSQFSGQAASTILNEVTSLQRSAINGPQEIFGQAADYILANPNGIYINGASFINAPRASFVVGSPQFDSVGQLHLDTLQAERLLEVGPQGLRNDQGAIALIAPRIEAQGDVLAPGKPLDILAGRNRIRHADNSVTESAQRSQAEQRYDASLFGAMRAGRIRIVSTSQGAGVRLASPLIQADDGVQIHSAGELQLIGDRRDANDIKLTRLDAGAGHLDLRSEGDMHLSALDASGGHINVRTSKNLYLDAATRKTIAKDNENWENKAWFVTTETYDRERTTTETRQLGSLFSTSGDMDVEVGENATVRGAFVRANGELRIKTGGDLQIEAAIDRTLVAQQSAHRKHLWRQDSRSETIEETAEQSLLLGGDIALHSGGKLRIGGSSLESRNDIAIKARSVDIDTVALKDSKSDKSYRGDLVSGHFFGDTAKDGDQRVTHQGSKVDAGGKLIIETERLAVRGSQVKGRADAQLISQADGVFIESVENIRKVESSTDSSQVFGLFKDDRSQAHDDTRNQGSEVHSQSNLKVVSPQEIVVRGSKVIADGALDLDAGGDVKIEAVKDRTLEKTEHITHGFSASAGETKVAEDGKPGSKQFMAQVGWEVNSDRTETVGEQLQGSLVQGKNLDIMAKGDVVIDSSKVKTTQGNGKITGDNLRFTSTDAHQTHERQSTRSGGYIGVEGGMDRIGSASLGEHETQRTLVQGTQAGRTELEINGDLQMIAGNGQGLIEKQGAKVEVAGTFTEQAGAVDNSAVHDTASTSTERTSWKGKAGLSVEYKDITRPLEKVANEEEQTRLQQNGVEDAMDPPSLGIDIAVAHQQRAASELSSTARGTEINAKRIDIDVAGALDDVGTHYAADKINIHADEHLLRAAVSKTGSTLDRLDVDTSLRVDTVTGSDINAKVLGVGSSLNSASTKETAVPGSLTGKQGIGIQVGTQGLYEGTRIDGGTGDVSITSGGALAMPQANDRQSTDEQALGGFGQLKLSTTPGAGKGALLLGKLDSKQGHTEDSQARVAQIDTTGTVKLQSQGDMRLEGTHIGEAQQPADIDLYAGGRMQVVASTDNHQASGHGMGGALQAGVSGNPTSGAKGASLGGAFATSRVDEQAQTAHGAQLSGRERIAIGSAAKADDAVHLQGLNTESRALQVSASNGGVLVESAQSTDHRDNIDLAAGAGISAKNNPADTSANTSGLYGRVKLGLEQLDSTTHSNARLKADSLTINSAADTRLAGANLEAGNITGTVGGDLHVETRQDQVDGLAVNVDLKLSKEKNPQGLVNGATSLAGPFGAKVQDAAGKRLSKVDPNITPTAAIDVVQQHRNTAPQATALNARQNIDLQVQGNTTLTGANLAADNIDLGAGDVTKIDLSGQDYRAEGGINGSNAPLDLVSGVKESFGKGADNGVNLGLIRGAGHNQTQTLNATVQER